MKQILFILIFLFVVHLNAYEYVIFNRPDEVTSGTTKYILYFDENDIFTLKYIEKNGTIVNYGRYAQMYGNLYNIKHNIQYYVTPQEFRNMYENDLIFLNDLLTTNNITLNSMLNYFYNNGKFNDSNHILYDNYELLYNADGLAVESIVGGVWAGLYDDNEKYQSGDLYDNLGRLKYYNGQPATPVDSFYVWLARFTHRIVGEVFQELSRAMIFGTILCIVLVLAMLYFCMENFLFVRPRRRSRPYYLYGEDGSRHTFRQVELEGKNYARLNPEWARRRREENERARAGR